MLHVLEAARGGTTRHVVDVVSSATGVEHHVAVPPAGREAAGSGATYDRAGVAAIEAAGGWLHYVDMRRAPVHPANVAAAMALRRLVGSVGADVVHGHSSVGGALARAVAATSRRPCIYTPNGLATGRASLAIERALGPLTTALVAVSESEGTRAAAARLCRPERIVVIPNGIDLTPRPPAGEDLRARLGVPADAPLVGTVARLVPQKAPEQFVAVARMIARQRPGAHFLLVGMGPLQDEVDRAVAGSDLAGRWHQIDYLPEAGAYFGQLDVFVLASRFEGGPYTPLEAMRAGTPVVLTDVVGNRDAVEPGVSGVLAPFGDVAGLAAGVERLLAEPGHRTAMAEAARRRLHDRFGLQDMGSRLVALYEQTAAAQDHRRPRRSAPLRRNEPI